MAGKSKVYGPYKGSAKNGGREIYAIRKADGSMTSTDRARLDYERKIGKSLPKSTEVDHKDNNKHNHKLSNLQTMSKSKNVAKGNQNRKK